MRVSANQLFLPATAGVVFGDGMGELAYLLVPAPQPIPPRTPWLLVHRDLRAFAPVRAVGAWVVGTFTDLLRPRRT
jgi:hypothetical protein